MRKLLLLTVLLCSASACSNIQPWVKAYERENLAKPVMQFSRSEIADGFRDHVNDIRGASRGAASTQGGGCGCN